MWEAVTTSRTKYKPNLRPGKHMWGNPRRTHTPTCTAESALRVSAVVIQSCEWVSKDAGKAHARLANMRQRHDDPCLQVRMLRDAMRPRGRNMQGMGA